MKGASSAVIDPNGTIIAQSEYGKNGVLVIPVFP
jgi:apolipoprotein N-acyltransferase